MKKSRSAEPQDVLFEIGCEELPATNLADAFENAVATATSAGRPETVYENRLRKAFEDRRIAFQDCRVWATPRRMVFSLTGVAPAQSAKEERVRLLVRSEAFGADGKPAEKLLAILGHRGASVDDVALGDWQGKEYAFLRKAEPVRKTKAVLPELFEALVRSLPFPKTMRWDDTGIVFPRPIRSALCFYGSEPIAFRIGRVKTSSDTVIFQKARRKRVVVKDIPDYFRTLKKFGILLCPEERKRAIAGELDRLARSVPGAKLHDDEFLLSEVNFLVENPNGLSAPFDPQFLSLPFEVLTVSMARKQRIFGLVDKEGKAIPRFLAVLDGKTGDREKKIISQNIEHILGAKLKDSLFFYREDVKIPLAKKREELKNLVFLKDAGSMLEKTRRLETLARGFSEELKLPILERAALERACALSKSDLLTQMVGEFPELQGVVGKYYALENGEPYEAAIAIGEQYLPRTANDRLPQTVPGALLSALDKCDLLVACFGMGLEPTSSLDPYGLRRSASAILKIALDRKISFSLKKLLQENDRLVWEAHGKNWPKAEASADKRVGKLLAFFRDRFKALLADRGFREDLVDAAAASGFDSPYETFQRVEALAQFQSDGALSQAAKVVERTSNVLRGNKDALPDRVDPALFSEELERAVFAKFEESHAGIRQAAQARDFKRATSLYAEAFFDILGEFFEKVFVNAEDANVRKNRLALLRSIKELYTASIADLSKIKSS